MRLTLVCKLCLVDLNPGRLRSWVTFERYFVLGGIPILRNRNVGLFLKGIGKNCIYVGGFWRIEKFSDMDISYFEGRSTAKFQSYGYSYCLNKSVTLCEGLNNVLVPKSDQ